MTQRHFYFLWLSPLWREPGPLFEQYRIPFTQNNLFQVSLILTCWFWRRFLKLFCYYLPLERGNPLYLNKIGIIPPKDDLCQVSLKLAQWFWRRLLHDLIPFLYFCNYISPLKRTWTFIWSKLNSLHPRIIYTMFDWIGLLVLEKKIFKNFQCILLFWYYLPLENGYFLCLNNISYTVSLGRNTESSRVWNGNPYWARRSIMPQTDCVTNLSRWRPLQCFYAFHWETLTYDIVIK
jgi:hypothetical protein